LPATLSEELVGGVDCQSVYLAKASETGSGLLARLSEELAGGFSCWVWHVVFTRRVLQVSDAMSSWSGSWVERASEALSLGV
jgi:hypothetical protein